MARDPSPRSAGYFWLALDDGDTFYGDKPVLVRITDTMEEAGHPPHVATYRVIRLTFVGQEFHELYADSFDEIKDGAIRKLSWDVGFGGFRMGSSDTEYRLNWLGAVRAPKLPAELRPL